MKRYRATVMAFALMLGLWLYGTATSVVEAGDYLGEVCWTFAYTTGLPGTSGNIKAGVYHMGGGYHLLGGLATVTTPSYRQSALHGNAEFIGSSIVLTLTYSETFPGEIATATYNVVLNPDTLSGTLKGGVFDFIEPYLYFAQVSGTVTHVQCP